MLNNGYTINIYPIALDLDSSSCWVPSFLSSR